MVPYVFYFDYTWKYWLSPYKSVEFVLSDVIEHEIINGWLAVPNVLIGNNDDLHTSTHFVYMELHHIYVNHVDYIYDLFYMKS